MVTLSTQALRQEDSVERGHGPSRELATVMPWGVLRIRVEVCEPGDRSNSGLLSTGD